MKKIKIIITTILLCFLCTGIVFAENGINTDDLTVSPSARSHDHVKKAYSNYAISAKLYSNPNHTYKVMYRVLNWNDEMPNCDWITVTEGGSQVWALYLSGRIEAAGDPIIAQWKNGTLLNPLTYTVSGYYIYY